MWGCPDPGFPITPSSSDSPKSRIRSPSALGFPPCYPTVSIPSALGSCLHSGCFGRFTPTAFILVQATVLSCPGEAQLTSQVMGWFRCFGLRPWLVRGKEAGGRVIRGPDLGSLAPLCPHPLVCLLGYLGGHQEPLTPVAQHTFFTARGDLNVSHIFRPQGLPGSLHLQEG